MALDKPYLDVPGTIIFDAEQSRKGYWINQFCMSLMKAENRERFKADERAYLDEWAMTEEQKQAVMARDLNWCMRTGGNIYFLAKIGATDGKCGNKVQAECSCVVVVDQENDIWFVVFHPLLAIFVTCKQRLPISFLGFA